MNKTKIMQHHTCSTSFISDSILENRSFLWTISDFSLSDSIVNVDNFFWKNKVGYFKEVFLKKNQINNMEY